MEHMLSVLFLITTTRQVTHGDSRAQTPCDVYMRSLRQGRVEEGQRGYVSDRLMLELSVRCPVCSTHQFVIKKNSRINMEPGSSDQRERLQMTPLDS